MVEQIVYDGIQPIDFGNADNFYPQAQREREKELQERAGIPTNTDFVGERRKLAIDLENQELEELYNASDLSLRNGVDAETIARYIQQYTPGVTKFDLDASLEIAAGRKEAEDAMSDNPITYQNALIDGVDTGRAMSNLESYSNMIEMVRNYCQSGSTWEKFKNYFRSFVDPNIHQTRTILSWLPEEIQKEGAWTSVGLGQSLSKYIRNAWETMNEADFAKAMQDLGTRLIRDNHNRVMVQDALEYMEHGGDFLIDTFSWFEAGSIGASIAKKSLKMYAKAGNVKKLAEEAADVVAKSADKAEVTKEIITPTATKAVQNPTEISIANTVANEVGETVAEQTAHDYVNSKMLTGVYTQDELDLVKDIVKKEVIDTFKETSIDPVDVMLTEKTDGSIRMSMLIGAADGSGVDSKRAHTIAKRLGLGIDEWELVNKDGRGFFVQVDRDVSDTTRVILAKGVDDNYEKVAQETAKEWSITGAGIFNSPLNGILRIFGGSTKVGAAAHARAVEADRVLQGILTNLNRTYRSSFNKLDKEGRKAFNTLVQEGLAGTGKWFTKEELNAKRLPDAIQNAYFDYKRVNDIEFFANNDDVRKTLMRKGYRQYGEVIGKEEKISTTNLGKVIIRDMDGNIVTDLSAFNDADHILIRVQRGHAIRTGADYTHIIAPRSQLVGKELPAIVTHYMPGGRRIYTRGTRFVKIGSGYYNPITKSTLNGFAKTMTTGTDVKQLQQYADEVNKVIDIYKAAGGDDGKAAKMFAEIDFQQFKADSWEQVKQLIKTKDNPSGLIDTRYKAQVLENKQKYDWGNTFDNLFDDMSDTDTALQDLLDVRANYSRMRGNILDDINGGTASIIDIDEMYDKTIRKAAYTMAKSELTHWYATELRKFAKVIDNWKDIQNMSDLEQLTHARTIVEGRAMLKESDRRLLRGAERFLGFAKRTLNARTKWDTYLENTMTRLAQAVDCALPTKFQRGDVYNFIAKFNPAKVGRAIGFNYVMGWWNPAQLVKQGLGVINVTALEPVNAAKAMMLYPLVRLSRASKANKGLLKFYKESALRMAGITSDEFDGMLKFLDRYGTESASGLLVGADRVYGEALKADASLLKKAWDTQYIFMQQGNAANFYIADIAAYLSKKGKTTREIAAYADDLFINMTKTSESAFQAGQILPTTVMAQWMTYPARMIEAMFNGRLTKAQRLQLLGSQLALWGVGGTFLNDKNELNMYTGLVQNDIDPTVADIATNGIFGAIAHELGINFDEGLAIQEQLANLVDIYDATAGEFKLPAIPAAQAWSQGIALYNAIGELVAPTTDDYDVWRYMKYLATTKNLPSSLRNVAKGALALRFQKFYDNHRRVLKDDATTIQAVAQMLGFGPYEGKQNTYMFEALNNREETLKQAVEAIKPFADAIVDYRIGETEHQEDIDKTLDMMYNRYNQEIRVWTETLKELYPDGDTLKSFRRQVTKLLAPTTVTVYEGREKETRKALGRAQEYIINRKSQEIRNNGER